ncbi:Cro/CI family transcriptional regulator [Morganella morganii]|uniref:Cro/CI family transcriptional regulator n=1 Tax=Morganella morganii TaxID=582 RepID=UPI00195D1A7A|nr:Cro/CI family transcriptional regulator [Morganella morganii]EKU5844107.1 hypothetical protein [Morganella morganii]MBM7211574.1 hypothetical protein [Morganella morganii]MBN4016997.1 hypothetical protein [Morganella morganii]QSB61408.1 hypothetical protein JW291_13820 [Morganella morganii]QSB89231.1 hypothetical protein JW297_12020 [Morganella morganii]
MKKITLSEFVSEVGQQKAADAFGIRQSAISKAIEKNRNIFVIQSDGVVLSAEEIKPFPRKSLGNLNASEPKHTDEVSP